LSEAGLEKTRVNLSLEAALKEAEERFSAANPKSAARQAEAEAVMPGGNTRTVLALSQNGTRKRPLGPVTPMLSRFCV